MARVDEQQKTTALAWALIWLILGAVLVGASIYQVWRWPSDIGVLILCAGFFGGCTLILMGVRRWLRL
jgi:hypothetical protein